MIKAIIFDFGEVLNAPLDEDQDAQLRRRLAGMLDLPPDELWPYLFECEASRLWMTGQLDWDGFWNAVSVHQTRPESVPDGAVVIKGKLQHGRIIYGIETYFIPEDARDVVEKDLRENQNQARVEVKVDSFGHAALVKLLIEDRVYEY